MRDEHAVAQACGIPSAGLTVFEQEIFFFVVWSTQQVGRGAFVGAEGVEPVEVGAVRELLNVEPAHEAALVG